ncbi:hypothetical protein LX16_3453 [Stackebrandtia albiflava]|uniref:DUF3137 domain-containing protein n=1 Tax=Stackebrandtia albiflava TaxID=406432 RepID=A0A562V487_9ACTN|nr:hypothetical protein [Stackebrandtia albiflava]TWJ12690.1 hypothetical protein LX16_3453 [Stackebrandtia albiflava]
MDVDGATDRTSPREQRAHGFDLSPLTARPRGAAWRRFRREAASGEHGTDLATRHGWQWMPRSLVIVGFLAILVAAPVVILTVEGPTSQAILGAALIAGFALIGGATTVAATWRDFWVTRTRRRYRLAGFARRNGLEYRPEPDVRRPAAHIFSGLVVGQRHLDRLSRPGFLTVANYQEVYDDDLDGSSSFEAGYVMFTLRESYPHTVVAREPGSPPRRLAHLEPVPGPAGGSVWSTRPDHPLLGRLLATGIAEVVFPLSRSAHIEIVDDTLFVLHVGGFLPVDSPRFWRRIAEGVGLLSPFLDIPTTTSPSEAAVAIDPVGR